MPLIQNPSTRNSPYSFQRVAGKKIAIVLSGGGMTCVYQVGVLQALREKFAVAPDIIVGSSGSAGTVAYFATEQFETIKHIWLDLLSTNKFISLWRIWKIMDIDYLIDVIFKKEALLDVLKLTKTKAKYFIAATNSETGRVRWFTNGAEQYIFEILRASKAMPVAYNKRVGIGGHSMLMGILVQHLVGVYEKQRMRELKLLSQSIIQ